MSAIHDVDYLAVLGRNFDLLSRSLFVSPTVVFSIFGSGFSKAELSQIDDQHTPAGKAESLLKLLSTANLQQQLAFKNFLSVLRRDGQEHVANIFRPESDEIPMSDERYQLIVSKQEELCDFLDPTCDLLNKLLTVAVFTKRDMDNVRSKMIIGYNEACLELVSILLRKSDSSFDKFIEALNSTEQQHVVYILTGQGESPLSRVRRLVLRKARDRLVERIDTLHTSLVNKLISSGVLADANKQRIEAHTVNEKATAVLIDIIARKSQFTYDKFLQGLKDSGHRQVAEELEGLELRGHVDLHFRSDTQPAERNRIVKILRNDMKALVGGTGPHIEELRSLMEQNGFAVSEISEGSIHISFTCFSKESFKNLERLYNDETLNKLFTQVFCPNFSEEGLESLTLNIADDEFHKCALKTGVISSTEYLEFTRIIDAGQRCRLPVEVLELVLMSTFIKLFTDSWKLHDTLIYSTLAGVCYAWWQTMNGWPQSRTKHWFKHKLLRALKSICHPYAVSPRLDHSMPMERQVRGVTHCDNKLFVVLHESNLIYVFGPNNETLTNIVLDNVYVPRDIVSCTNTKQLYVDDSRFVWRVSLDGLQVLKWLPNKSSTTTSSVIPYTMSVTSRRLLVTSQSNELLLYGPDGDELERISLTNMAGLQHAVEIPHGTFIVSHFKPGPRVCEVNVDGHVICIYNIHKLVVRPIYLLVDPDGRIFVADRGNKSGTGRGHRVLLLNSRLELERVLLNERYKLSVPRRLCYMAETGQLVVASAKEFTHFTVRN